MDRLTIQLIRLGASYDCHQSEFSISGAEAITFNGMQSNALLLISEDKARYNINVRSMAALDLVPRTRIAVACPQEAY